ncbi:sulfoxide reductase heme-binding subunit YedZ [Variibacter gotjawalensis]|uniref:Protein-methionine-sulfoxide reductase heme-binding subunit MsrQ n=1 Tax=Variibacter gotjawalensis TaxID=1333996 RepID=A0A0S3PTZ0_9BRAD|nr:protein-methionine-sulfoxide reductase heme-binding subunit MsrQ [Variibacter gotjawalensis]NIK49679.1 sulfoxide reductase heme-binding subunit YedZ [Variibacter gotjawalensis]RZS45691.1 sulfoxide reductase heme-binding subunit YedZ [Variibacter gotjawalensis]BAT59362.1 sulfoxide reductase heme-binding subunit YedZ [Variibacter gotjawalensis]
MFLREKNGRWSPEKILAFAVSIAPLIWLAWRTWTIDLGPRPATEALHFTGRWSVRLLLLSLMISPARRLFPVGKPMLARRTLGVAACCYAVFHFVLYIVQERYDFLKVATEIVLRFYLTIGFVALIGLIALGVTSTDAMIRKLGPRWNTLHRVVYAIGILVILHFMLQKKLEIYEPVLMFGLMLWLFGYRLLHRYANAGWVSLIGLSIASSLLTALFEAGWYAVKTGANAVMVLQANLEFEYDIRPMWWVLAAGLAVTFVSLVAQWWWPKPAPRLRSARA